MANLFCSGNAPGLPGMSGANSTGSSSSSSRQNNGDSKGKGRKEKKSTSNNNSNSMTNNSGSSGMNLNAGTSSSPSSYKVKTMLSHYSHFDIQCSTYSNLPQTKKHSLSAIIVQICPKSIQSNCSTQRATCNASSRSSRWQFGVSSRNLIFILICSILMFICILMVQIT